MMPGKGYTETDNRNIYREFKKRFGSSFELEIHETDEFEYTPRGKSKFLIQKINI